MKTLFAIAVTTAAFTGAFAQEAPVVPYDSLMDDRVSLDGYVDREELEYPGYLKNPATGLTVSWGHDDDYIYLAVETRGRGWLSIGFGKEGMDGANILAAFYSDDSSEAYDLVGKGFSHETAGHLDDLDVDWDIDFDDDVGVTTFEVAYPLTWQVDSLPEAFAASEALKTTALTGLTPGGEYELILAQNTKTVSLQAKHTHRSKTKFRLAPRPVPPAETAPAPTGAAGEGD